MLHHRGQLLLNRSLVCWSNLAFRSSRGTTSKDTDITHAVPLTLQALLRCKRSFGVTLINTKPCLCMWIGLVETG